MKICGFVLIHRCSIFGQQENISNTVREVGAASWAVQKLIRQRFASGSTCPYSRPYTLFKDTWVSFSSVKGQVCSDLNIYEGLFTKEWLWDCFKFDVVKVDSVLVNIPLVNTPSKHVARKRKSFSEHKARNAFDRKSRKHV